MLCKPRLLPLSYAHTISKAATMSSKMQYDRCQRLEAYPDQITSLKLTVTNMKRAQQTLDALRQATNLASLFLVCNVPDDGVGAVCRDTLSRCPVLSDLTLQFAECTDEGASHIAELMQTSHTLKSLSLRLNNVGEKGAKQLAVALKHSHLKQFAIYATQLDLHDRNIGDRGAGHFADEIKGCTKLESLCIAQSGITSEGIDSLLSALETNEVVHTLHLQSNRIGKDGASKIALFLTKTRSLSHLALDGNEIGNSGTKELALALCRNETLEVLSLKSCGIGRLGAERFAQALQQNSTLIQLDLSGNVEMSSNAFELIGRGLKCNKALQKLHLSSCEVNDEGCSYLADALLENSTLTELGLEKNEISDSGVIRLATNLETNK